MEIEDKLEGGVYQARAAVTVNVAGPWVDRVLGSAGSFGSEEGSPNGSAGQDDTEQGRMIGPTKGSHLVVDPFPGAPKSALYVEARKDGRPYFIVPWNGRYLIGTTDFRYEDDLDYASAGQDEIDYLIDETNAMIPEANLTRDSVLFTYSGVRPLPFEPAGSESSITRAHVVFDHAKGKSAAGGRVKISDGPKKAEGLISIIGGKLTTYRNLGCQTVDAVYKKLGTKPPKSATDRVPLPGGAVRYLDAFATEFKSRSGLEDDLDVVATMDDVERGKPDPEIDLLVAKKLGVPPEEFLVIEDSSAGVEAGVAAGMVVVAVPTRITSKGVHASNLLEPRWVVEDPETLSDVVRQRIEEAGGKREGNTQPRT